LVLAWRWEQLGAEDGDTTVDGAAGTTTSTSTITTISSTTRIGKTSVTAIVPLSSPIVEVEATTGSTIRNTEAGLLIQTETLRTSMEAQVAGLPSLTVRPTRGNSNLVNRAADSKPAPWIAAARVEVDNSRAAVTVAVEASGWAIDKCLAERAGEILAPSVVLPEAEVRQEPAARGAAPAWGVVAAAGAAVGDGDK
jgi:hypothetical protein